MACGGISIEFEAMCWHCDGRGYQWPMDDEPDETKQKECTVCRGHKVVPTAIGEAALRLIDHNPEGMKSVWPRSSKP